MSHRLLDIQGTRLGEMDKHGIEMMILSLNAPADSGDPRCEESQWRSRSRQTMYLAGEVRKRPNRFAAFAALPMQDPRSPRPPKLERCVKELGMVGALVNGFSQDGMPDNMLTTTFRVIGRFGAR